MHDLIIIGGGPAGVSAALTARRRGKTVLCISNPAEQSGLWGAKLVDNYPGMPKVTGPEMLKVFRAQLEESGADVISGRVLSAMPMCGCFGVSVGQDFYDAKALIIATGIVQAQTFPGEDGLLGKGVSYCATCDGMLYRGKKVAVIGLNEDATNEADFLRSIGVDVEYFDSSRARKYEVVGSDKVEALIADGVRYDVDGIFILRDTLAPASLLPGIEMSYGFVMVDDKMATSVEGVFAAGDCIGKPYQIARAIGQGNTAALSACEYLDKK